MGMEKEIRTFVSSLAGSIPRELLPEIKGVLIDCQSLIDLRHRAHSVNQHNGKPAPLYRRPDSSPTHSRFKARMKNLEAGFWNKVLNALSSFGRYQESDGKPINFQRYESLRSLMVILIHGGDGLPSKTYQEKSVTQQDISESVKSAANVLKRDPFFEEMTLRDLGKFSPQENIRSQKLARLEGALYRMIKKIPKGATAECFDEFLPGLSEVISCSVEYESQGWSSDKLYTLLENVATAAEMSSQTIAQAGKDKMLSHREANISSYWFQGMVNNGDPKSSLSKNGARFIDLMPLDLFPEYNGKLPALYGDFEPVHRKEFQSSHGEDTDLRLETDKAKKFAKALKYWFKNHSNVSITPKTEICVLTGISTDQYNRL